VIAQRELWRELSAGLDLARLVFVDETGAKTNMTRAYGRAAGGHRAVDHAPAGHWSTTTLLSSLRQDARSAAMVIEGSTDAEVFHAYVQQVLVPVLRPGEHDGSTAVGKGGYENRHLFPRHGRQVTRQA
jgi:hypothetical protein